MIRRLKLYVFSLIPAALLGIGGGILGLGGLPHYQGFLVLACWSVSGVFLGVVFYMMRREARLVYGIYEILFGVGTIVGTLVNIAVVFSEPRGGIRFFPGQDRFTALFLFGASIYVLVRGLDNAGEGLKEYPRAYVIWNNFFSTKDGH